MTPGIYAIRNTITGLVYIGASGNVAHRWSIHKAQLRKGTHPNPGLQAAWTSDGEAAFNLIVLEETSAADMRAAERRWVAMTGIDKCYNIYQPPQTIEQNDKVRSIYGRYTAIQVGTLLGISPVTVRALAAKHGIGERFGKCTVLFSKADADAIRNLPDRRRSRA